METITTFGPKHVSQLSFPSRTNLFPEMKMFGFPIFSFPRKPTKQFCLKATTTPSWDGRTFTKLPSSEWTNYFHCVSVEVSEMDALEKEIEALKPKVGEMLVSSNDVQSLKKRIHVIYLLVSLGLAYHFEDEIEEILRADFEMIEEMMAGENDLYTVSTIFWVFRTYGHNISSEVFTRFKEDNGKFKECLSEDVMGMLSMYEAAHLATTTDYMMDEALSFVSNKLALLVEDEMCPAHLSRHIKNALVVSQHWNMEIIVAVQYIQFYEQEDSYDEMLLKFAKLNFNLLQRLYLKEVKILTKWYKDHDCPSKLPPYYRALIVEMHFFTLASFEPQFSRARIMQAKLFMTELLVDDTCDRYASFPEMGSLIHSLERWAPDDAMDKQPDYLKFVLHFVMDTLNECERELEQQGRSYSFKKTKEVFKRFVTSNLDLAKLAPAGHVPSFEDYMEIGKIEFGAYIIIAGALMGMDQINAKEAYEWLKSRSKLLESVAENARYQNDLAGFEDDMRRGVVSTGINCYMKQYGVTKEEASRYFQKMIVITGKEMNEEFLKKSDVSRQILKIAFGCVRAVYIAYYVGEEKATNPEGKIVKYMNMVYVNRICF
ncbi:putative terpenoid synthase 16 [Cardamine amara subsp. amara]|uniref:Terpenoid synthase 16 n=1 Tax=Cardamine amara subsp. amara TaxID=228776 RepID=A0ABD1C144_CARAN